MRRATLLALVLAVALLSAEAQQVVNNTTTTPAETQLTQTELASDKQTTTRHYRDAFRKIGTWVQTQLRTRQATQGLGGFIISLWLFVRIASVLDYHFEDSDNIFLEILLTFYRSFVFLFNVPEEGLQDYNINKVWGNVSMSIALIGIVYDMIRPQMGLMFEIVALVILLLKLPLIKLGIGSRGEQCGFGEATGRMYYTKWDLRVDCGAEGVLSVTGTATPRPPPTPGAPPTVEVIYKCQPDTVADAGLIYKVRLVSERYTKSNPIARLKSSLASSGIVYTSTQSSTHAEVMFQRCDEFHGQSGALLYGIKKAS